MNYIDHVHKVTNQAVEEGYNGANIAWKEMAHDCLKRTCERMETFTVNDVRNRVEQSSIKTSDKRAMGGVMRWGVKLGMMEGTGQTIPSLKFHGIPMQVWKSKIYKPKQTLF